MSKTANTHSDLIKSRLVDGKYMHDCAFTLCPKTSPYRGVIVRHLAADHPEAGVTAAASSVAAAAKPKLAKATTARVDTPPADLMAMTLADVVALLRKRAGGVAALAAMTDDRNAWRDRARAAERQMARAAKALTS